VTLVDPAWVAARLDDPNVAIVDFRWREDGSGRARYEAGHLPGAIFLDWTADIVEPAAPYAFTLAGPRRFARAMGSRGIGDDTTVVAYADERGSGPFRLWWAFRVYGHDGVHILDGGLERWVEEGRPLEPGTPPARAPATWTSREGPGRTATADDVARAPDEGVPVLDSRPAAQFRGEAVWFETGQIRPDERGVAHTPRGDIRAGRVPWAANVPWYELYRKDRTLKPVEELREIAEAAGARPGERAITYCGVGISAAALAYALELAGVRAEVYDAAWDEWGRTDRPIARG
jgi:thiosulfate/3-mercaptopyruvate sulfurtransferase